MIAKSIENAKHGQKFRCKIKNEVVTGHISLNDVGRIYLCHDERLTFGEATTDRLGYKYSYTVRDGSEKALVDNDVKEFNLLKETMSKTFIAKCKQVIEDARKQKEAEDKLSNKQYEKRMEIMKRLFSGSRGFGPMGMMEGVTDFIIETQEKMATMQEEINYLKKFHPGKF